MFTTKRAERISGLILCGDPPGECPTIYTSSSESIFQGYIPNSAELDFLGLSSAKGVIRFPVEFYASFLWQRLRQIGHQTDLKSLIKILTTKDPYGLLVRKERSLFLNSSTLSKGETSQLILPTKLPGEDPEQFVDFSQAHKLLSWVIESLNTQAA